MPTRMLRADAQDNRDRVLAAARELFAEQGLGITMRDIARRAEVGPATLYRRFATKRELVFAAFGDEVRECRAIAHDAAAHPDAWTGFCEMVERIAVLNSRNQGFTDAFLSAYPDALDLRRHRLEMLRVLAGVAERAQRAGELRGDFTMDDLLVILHATRGLTTVPAAARTAAARRFAALAIDGLRASPEHGALPPRPRLLRGAAAG